ncbi:MAG: penicillin-binding protein activator [Rhodospirillales bacterium]|nr:penicillin-binding protein activator [Rhodospirillales bacterium]HIJ44410.1 penicillin-binding protein activator [Rhodospirillaceae bacterium]HIJ45673.1 penicillin-binding protein activator [Rhodospirillaceae bacterium]HIJ93992.1 penicillin-binding protein activator [Rhodospirillaceae bacterium]
MTACESPRLTGLMQDRMVRIPESSSPPPPRAPPGVAAPPLASPPTAAPASRLSSPRGVPGSQPVNKKLPSFLPFLYRQVPENRELTPPVPAPPMTMTSGVRVALLLPLSGSNARLGEAMRDAAQLALFDFADDDFELLLYDTKGTPEGASDAATLAIGDGASVILGPLLSSSVRALTPQARAANVTVLAFSSDSSVSGEGVYTMGFYPNAEVARVVSFARSRGILRFAALVPDNDYGEAVAGTLRLAAEAADAQVTQVQFYDPAADDLSDTVRVLADYDTRRQVLVAQMAELEKQDSEVARRALKRLEKMQTIGELPFDALLLADGGKRLQAIAAWLPFYDIDPGKIRILGTGLWDEPGIGAEPALVGGWFAAPSPAARADFERQYERIYGQKAPRRATLAYDATLLAVLLAKKEGGADFSAPALTNPSGYLGSDGIFRLLANGRAERGLAVMQIRRHGAEVISVAPKTFQAATN